MKSFQRKVVACVAGIINGHEHSLCLIDHDTEEFTHFFCHLTDQGFELRSIDNKVLYSVEKKPVKWVIQDLSTKKTIELEKFSDRFKGYDHESFSYFTIVEKDKGLKMYDFETDDFHYFSLEKQFQ